MTSPPSDYRDYQALLLAFLEGRASAEDHSRRFFTLFQQDGRRFPEPVYDALNGHQLACEAFTRDEAPLHDFARWLVDETELRQNAAEALETIRRS